MSLPDAVVLFGASGFIGRNIVAVLGDRIELLVGVNRSGDAIPGCTRTIAAAAIATPIIQSRVMRGNST